MSSNTIKKALIFVLFCCVVHLLTACSQLTEVTSIEVEIWYNGSPLECNEFEKEGELWSIEQLAFFMSDIYISEGNDEAQAALSTTPWQTNELVLIKPNLSNCVTSSKDKSDTTLDTQVIQEGSSANSSLQFLAPIDLDASETLSFSLAVPFAENHQNPLLQPSPLNVPSMFWSWRSGHKFFRLDMQSPNKNWVFHLGSVGCTAVSTMRSPQKECEQHNRVAFNLQKKGDGTKLVIHVDRLVAGVSLQNNSSCLFHSGQDSCTVLTSNLKTKEVFEWH